MMSMVMNEKSKAYYRRRALMISAVAMMVVYILWNVEFFDFLVYPLRLFVTYVHEAGHSLMAIVTGGEVRSFVVSANGSGYAITAGGSRALILPAGYVGAALFGSLLFYLANRLPRAGRLLAVALGLGMAVFTVLFARPDESGAPLAMIVGILTGLALIGVAWWANTLLTLLVLNVLALMTALNAVLDLWGLIRFADTAARGSVVNDAAAFSREVAPLLSPAVVALIWAAIAVAMLAAAVWYGLFKPLRKEIDHSFDALRSKG